MFHMTWFHMNLVSYDNFLKKKQFFRLQKRWLQMRILLSKIRIYRYIDRQKLGYSAIISNIRIILSKTQFTSYITLKARIKRARTKGRSFISTSTLYKSGVKKGELAEFGKKNATQIMIFLPHLCGRKITSRFQLDYLNCFILIDALLRLFTGK